MLAFARKQPLYPVWIDINDLVRAVAPDLVSTAGNGYHIDVQLSDSAILIHVDRNEFATALTNVVSNARDAMPSGGTIVIRTDHRQIDTGNRVANDLRPGSYGVVEVRDSGDGMPPDIIDRIFDPFFTTKGVDQGTGLGLSMVFGFSKQSDGHVTIDSEQGSGTCVTLWFPEERALAKDVPYTEMPSAVTADGPTPGSVLVVEDNAALRQATVRYLLSLNLDVAEAEDAHAAIATLEAGKWFDVVFSDVVMSGSINGYELARIIRERWPSIRVLLTTGLHGTDSETFAAGIKVIRKPYGQAFLKQNLLPMLARA
jgi:CheY-like chemotaxis protein